MADDDQLKNWYFARHELFDAPVDSLIEKHAELRLSRALSVGRLTAFVGSGASMAYGRSSWIDMLVGVQEDVLKRYTTAERGDWSPSAEAVRLKGLLDQHKIKPSAAGDESKQLTVFQLAEKLGMALDAAAAQTGNGAAANQSDSKFRRNVMELTRDHRGHADRLADLLANESGGTANEIVGKLANFKSLIRRTDPNERGRTAANLLGQQSQEKELAPVNADNIRTILSPKLDPLAIVLHDLGIKRFLTLNYDHEIEFALNSEQDPLNVQPPREIVFDEDQCGALIAAAVGGRHNPPFVAHLHGRAEEHGQGELIVTEQDYRRRYHRPGGMRRLIDDAIRIAFSSSPLLFLGIGMKEVDLMRPLKQFLGSDRYLGEQLAVALLPAMKSDKDLGFEKIDLLKKFGVYCVHYGRTEVNVTNEKTVPWFSTLFDVHKQITEVFDAVLPSGLATSKDVKDHIANIQKDPGLSGLKKLLRESRVAVSKSLAIKSLFEVPKELDGEPLVATETEKKMLRGALTDVKDVADWFVGRSVLQTIAQTANVTRRNTRAIIRNNLRIREANNVVFTFCLCNKLRLVRKDYLYWRDRWFRLPEVRPAQLHGPNSKLFLRHMLDIPPLAGDTVTIDKRFYSGAPSQAFAAAKAALTSQEWNSPPTGRRIFLFIGHRGVGRGHFFATLQDDSEDGRLRQFIKATGQDFKEYAVVGLFNLTFSLEVKSVFDQIAALLWRFGNSPPLAMKQLKESSDWRQWESNQKFRLHQGLKRCIGTSRILIGLNGLEALFRPDGRPKNRHVGELFDLLVHPEFEDCPIDLVLLCSDKAVPVQFRRTETADAKGSEAGSRSRLRLKHLVREDISDRDERDLKERVDRLDLNLLEPDSKETPRNFTIFLRHPLASAFTAAYFVSVGLAAAARAIDKAESPGSGQPSKEPPRLPKCQMIDLNNASLVRKIIHESFGKVKGPQLRLGAPAVLIAAAWLRGGSMANANLSNIYQAVLPALGKIDSEDQTLGSEKERNVLDNFFTAAVNGCSRSSSILREATAILNDWFRDLFKDLGRSRYLMTIVLAAGYDRIANPIKGQENKAAQECLDLIDDVCRRVRNLPEPTRSSSVIEIVLESGRDLYLAGGQRTFATYADPYLGNEDVADPNVRREIRQRFLSLQQEILWHLAAMGHPVELDALICCPDIYSEASRLAKLIDDRGDERPVSVVVMNAATTLVARCLVFKVSRRPQGGSGEQRDRYIIHRQLQRHVYKSMGAPLVEPQTVDHYSVTLYADQPNEAPVLTVAAHKKLQRVVAALSGYPGKGGSPPHTVNRNNLKAALGILRNCYSVASVARLDQHAASRAGGGSIESLSPGCFEEHRLYLRWLIEQAKNAKDGSSAPFYLEELVWLYNECGVISYIEGQVQDAVALLYMADKAASKLEPGDEGPLRLTIRLNRALVDIDMGNLSSARAKLKSIIAIERTQPDDLRDDTLLLLARGYEALVDHISGNYDQSKRTYRDVIRRLALAGRSRAAAIFARHLGDLLRFHGDLPDARKALEEALQFATSGSHEDVRHQILLSLIRVKLMDDESPKINQVMAELEVVETYALTMGVPKLLAEIDELRGKFHRRGGDLSAASTYASQSLALASQQDLRIRKASALGLLAEVHLDMGFIGHCRAELDELRSLARQIDYQAASIAAQRISNQLSWRHGADLAPPV